MKHLLWIALFMSIMPLEARSAPPEAYDSIRLCDAIYKAEGGAKATYLYGIRSIPYKDASEARRICLNTINNNKGRYYKQTRYKDYLDFLASRYCPTTGNLSKAEKELNGNWIKNVRYFYERSK
jgi:hypothetical protein